MDVKSTPKKKTSTDKSEKKPPPDSAQLKAMFIAAAVSMGWQLAVAVVVPIVGGYYLDQHFNTSPVLEISGFVVAAAGFFVVLKRQVSSLDDMSKKRGLK